MLYFAAVTGLDEQFGRLMQAVKRLGLEEDTLIVLTADHGDMMGSHGLMAKHVWYEESIGIPLVIGGAGMPAGRCGQVLGSADLAPTLLELLGLPVPGTMEGVSAASAVLQGSSGEGSFTYLYACPGGPGLLGPLKEAGIDPKSVGWRGVRDKRYTYVVDAGYTPGAPLRRLLYDLAADPLQKSPLELASAAGHPAARLAEERLRGWLQKEGDPFLQRL